jgi:hypothetical protein
VSREFVKPARAVVCERCRRESQNGRPPAGSRDLIVACDSWTTADNPAGEDGRLCRAVAIHGQQSAYPRAAGSH